MEIHLDSAIADQGWAQEAQDIVRKCVHCGFCTATCPTYQLLGHESDSPRGRIYLIKQLLEGKKANAETQAHLDRCLLCRACETTCPSGVHYAHLLETGRTLVEQQRKRHGLNWLKRKAMTYVIPNPSLMQFGTQFGKPFRKVLPTAMATQLPAVGKNLARPTKVHGRKMLLLEGCAQSSLTPETNAATARVLDQFGIMLVSEEKPGCCGAVRLHTSERDKGLDDVRQRIDTWWPRIQASGVEAIISTASGCGVTLKDYGALLKDDPEYADKATHIASMVVDLAEVVAIEIAKQPAKQPAKPPQELTVAFHSPCTLQHGQQINGVVETILNQSGYTLVPVADSHLCCGSAGTYSVLQPALSQQLKTDKLENLQTHSPDIIATANIGCQLHLRADAGVPVVHWIELLDVIV